MVRWPLYDILVSDTSRTQRLSSLYAELLRVDHNTAPSDAAPAALTSLRRCGSITALYQAMQHMQHSPHLRNVLQAEEPRSAPAASGRPEAHCRDLRRSSARRPGELQRDSAAAGAPAVQERPRGHRHRRQLRFTGTGTAPFGRNMSC